MTAPLVEPVGDLFAVDPALQSPGVALYRGGVLIAADRVRIDPDYTQLPIGARAARIAADIIRWAVAHDAEPRALVIERPKIYPPGRLKDKKGRPITPDADDILGIAWVAGAVAGELSLLVSKRDIALVVHSPDPGEWTGGLPKVTTGDPWESPRARRLAGLLSTDELECVAKSHDAIDGAALGAWALGRWDLPRVNHRPGESTLVH